jgi:hypothetical protein
MSAGGVREPAYAPGGRDRRDRSHRRRARLGLTLLAAAP